MGLRSSRIRDKILLISRAISIKLSLFAALLLTANVISSCDIETLEIGPITTEEVVVELGQAQSTEVDVSLGAGSLYMDGGGADLLEAVFSFNVPDWRPEVRYDESGDLGRLSIEQPKFRDALPAKMGDIEYQWHLQLNNAVPMDLSITMGAGDGKLTLSDLALESFTFKGGAGSMDIDLHSSRISDLDVALGAGDVVLDLGGMWQQNLEAKVKGGVGRVTLILPRESGVRISTQGLLSKITAPKLINHEGVYTNDAFGRSDTAMNIKIEAGIGEIVLELGDMSNG
ncbi:MAG: toast rack family protein [Candidatus Promineifilaceae bacterium]